MQSLTTHVVTGDGAKLATDVCLPDGEGPWPATLFRTPYLRTNEFYPLTPGADLPIAVVLQDVRGRFGSSGAFDMGATDAADGAATIAWIAQQPWCNGDVAMHGVSYAGHTQLQAARAHPPALRAITPIRCPAWWRPLSMHEGGAFRLSLAAHWLPLQAADAPECPEATRRALHEVAVQFEQICDYPPGPPTPQVTLNLERARAHPGLSRLPYRDRPEYDRVPRYRDIWHGFFDRPFTRSWTSDSGPAPSDHPACPTLIISGWYDVWAQDAVAMQQAMARAQQDCRLVITPASHAPSPAGELETGPSAARFDDMLAIAWIREWLLDQAPTVRALAPVTYFVMVANAWEEASTWPPPRTVSARLFLDGGGDGPGGSLQMAPPQIAASRSFVHDPRDPVPTMGGASLGLPPGPVEQSSVTGGARPDVVSFTSEPLAEDIDILGQVSAEIWLATDARDTDVVVKLLDVWPDRRSYNIVDGIVRGRFRSGGEAEVLTPGVVTRFRVHCWNIAYGVSAGHRLRVDVCSSSFPRHDPNPASGLPLGTDGDGDLRAAMQRIHCGGRHPSHVEVTVRGHLSLGD